MMMMMTSQERVSLYIRLNLYRSSDQIVQFNQYVNRYNR